jgi:signal transduction histidine kinase
MMLTIAFSGVIMALLSTIIFLTLRLKQKAFQHDSQLTLLQKLSEENRTLISILFHDLATPISVLEFAIQKLKREKVQAEDPARYGKTIEKITNSMSVMRDVLSKVKALQEIRSGKKNLNLESVDPVAVTQEIVQLFEDRLTEKKIDIRIDSYLDEKNTIKADRSLLKNEVLANVISNAIKFSPENRIIEISFIRENDHQTLIQVRDYGIGIPTDLIPKLFDFNGQTNRPGTADESGTGFGLPLAKTCTQLMSGSIDVESHTYQPGVSSSGTAFNLRFLTDKSDTRH